MTSHLAGRCVVLFTSTNHEISVVLQTGTENDLVLIGRRNLLLTLQVSWGSSAREVWTVRSSSLHTPHGLCPQLASPSGSNGGRRCICPGCRGVSGCSRPRPNRLLVADQSNPWLSMLGMVRPRRTGLGSGAIGGRQGSDCHQPPRHPRCAGSAREHLGRQSHAQKWSAVIPSTDLAVLDIDGPSPSAMPLATPTMCAWANGSWPWATRLNLTSTVTAGIVSAKGRNIRLLESDASRDIFPVESFSANRCGSESGQQWWRFGQLGRQLIGINTAIASQTGSYAGYSFAIPSSIVAKVTQDIGGIWPRAAGLFGHSSGSARQPVSGGLHPFLTAAHAAGLRTRRPHPCRERHRRVLFSFSCKNNFPNTDPGDKVSLTLRARANRFRRDVTLTDRGGTTRRGDDRTSNRAVPQRTAPHGSRLNEPTLREHWGVLTGSAPSSLKQQLHIRGGVMVTGHRDGSWRNQGMSEDSSSCASMAAQC